MESAAKSNELGLETPLLWIVEDDEDTVFIYKEVFGSKLRLRVINSLTVLSVAVEKVRLGMEPRPDLILADLRLTDGDFLENLKKGFFVTMTGTPLIVVSSCDEEKKIRDAFKEGSMDYIVKPFTKNELLVKVERHLSPLEDGRDKKYLFRLVPEQLFLQRGNENPVRMTPKEIQILSVFRDSDQGTVDRDVLQRMVWGETQVGDKTLDVHLVNLRRKLELMGANINYVAPNSYRFLGDWVKRSK
jgi:two-component system, OmpR family, response regulator ResD